MGELMYLLPDALIYRNMDQIVMIQQVDSNQTELEYQKEMEEVEDVIQRSILIERKIQTSDWYRKKCGRVSTAERILSRSKSGYQVYRHYPPGDW